MGVLDLERGVVWVTCNLTHEGSTDRDVANSVANYISANGVSSPTGVIPTMSAVTNALLLPSERESYSRVHHVNVIIPEMSDSLGHCRWDGDGHYDLSRHAETGLPTLGQIVTFAQMVDASSDCLVIQVSSNERLATGALLAGAVLVLARGLSADSAWAKLLQAAPKPSGDAAQAWDRFSRPFCSKPSTSQSSVTVQDCLLGLQYARDFGWLGPLGFRGFDSNHWRYLRQKFDASWLIPNEILGMAHPWETAQNPRFSGLLSPSPGDIEVEEVEEGDYPPLMRPQRTGFRRGQSPCSTSPSSTPRSRASSFGCIDMWALDNALESPEIHMVGLDEPAEILSPLSTGDAHDNPPRSMQLIASPRSSNVSEIDVLRNSTFVTFLRRERVQTVVRTNCSFECLQQDGYIEPFTSSGIHVAESAFPDGGVPSSEIVKSFLRTCKRSTNEGNCVAVHCMGGLGRTGTLVGAYAVAQYGIPGIAFHGWVRMARPGSIQTVAQEEFLRRLQPKMRRKTSSDMMSQFVTGLKKVASWGSSLSTHS